MTGKAQLEEKMKEIKEEIFINKEAKKEEFKKDLVEGLALVSKNSELLKLYKDNSQVGSENIGGQSPLLKVHSTGRSTTNQLADGKEPNDGWFFYKPSGEQFKSVECHILSISKGFRATGIDNKKNVFNQIMAGVIINDGDLKPFITYLTGTKLKKMWEFGKEVSKYTHARPIAIPMFALKVKLSTEKIKTDFGMSWVINFEVIKNEDGSPVVVTDLGMFTFLRDHVETVEDTIASLISAKVSDDEVDGVKAEVVPHPAETIPF